MFENQKEVATKAFYAAVGAPVVIGRTMRETGEKMADKVSASATAQFEDFAKEGEKLTKQLQGNNVVEELQSRVDLDKVQGRVEQLRDQLDAALQSWRESFAPEGTKPAQKVPVEETTATEAPAPKTTTKKTTATKAPAAKTTTKKTATAKKAPAKKAPAAKTTTKKTATAKKAPAKTAG